MNGDSAPGTLEPRILYPGARIVETPDYIALLFDRTQRVVSSAILGGGAGQADQYLNLRVPGEAVADLPPPAVTLADRARSLGFEGATIGMMTAASMDSMRHRSERIKQDWLGVLVTTGVENARRAGDQADSCDVEWEPSQSGTINIAVATTLCLSPAALVEATMIVTEAKVAAVHQRGITSPVSGELATGTGTDSIAVFAATTGKSLAYVGKHTYFGERLAAMVIDSITSSLSWSGGTQPCD